MDMTPPNAMNNATHQVTNQVPPLQDTNIYLSNLALREAVARDGAGWADAWLAERGAELGSAEMIGLGRTANQYPPTLKLFHPTGERADQAEFHPAYHALMAYVKKHGGSGRPWAEPKAGAHEARPPRAGSGQRSAPSARPGAWSAGTRWWRGCPGGPVR